MAHTVLKNNFYFIGQLGQTHVLSYLIWVCLRCMLSFHVCSSNEISSQVHARSTNNVFIPHTYRYLVIFAMNYFFLLFWNHFYIARYAKLRNYFWYCLPRNFLIRKKRLMQIKKSRTYSPFLTILKFCDTRGQWIHDKQCINFWSFEIKEL